MSWKNFRPRPASRAGGKFATVSMQVTGTATLTNSGTKVYRIPTPYRKCNFVRGTASVTTVPICASGTITGTFKKYDASADHLEAIGTLAITTPAEKFKTTSTAAYQVSGTRYTKAATDALTFSAAHTITASKYGCVLVQINAAGTISTKVVSATQAYDDAPTALAALPSPDTGCVKLGHIAIANNTGDWVANTDDLTNGSDVTTASFVDNTAGTTSGVTLSSGVDMEALTTREVAKFSTTADPDDCRIDEKDCLEFHVTATNTVGTQPTDLSVQVELAVLE